MGQAGNRYYSEDDEFPDRVPVFPLTGALLLPGGQLPLNIFEPRYLAMIDDAMAGDRLIAMVQPDLDGRLLPDGEPELAQVGCLGRITSVAETGDGRYMVTLHGIARFRLLRELKSRHPYRMCEMAVFANDLDLSEGAEAVDRQGLLNAFREYLDANDLEADWESVEKSPNETLVNVLCMMIAPAGAPERQAILEAPDLKMRAETLIAITEIALAQESDEPGTRTLQ